MSRILLYSTHTYDDYYKSVTVFGSSEVHRFYSNFTRTGIDLAIGGTVMSSKHINKVEYLRPHTQISLTYYVADAVNMKCWDTLHTMFSTGVWCVLALSLVLGGLTYSLLFEGTFNIQRTKFLHLLAIVVMQTLDFPVRWRTRLFLTVFLFPLYHISSLHSTALQSYMVHTPKEKPIMTEMELRTANMTVYTSPLTRELISESKAHENMKISKKRLLDRLHTLDMKKNYSILARSLEVDFWRNTQHFNIHPIKPPVSTFAVSLTMGKGSPYFDTVDSLAQQCLESGLFEKWVADLTSLKRSQPKQALYDSNALEAIDVEDLECAFLLLLVGLMVSSVTFVIEVHFPSWEETIRRRLRKKRLDDRNAKRVMHYYVFQKKGLY